MTGEEAWCDFECWPPKGYEERRFHLHTGGALAVEPAAASDTDTYRYDPADPTPSVGGVALVPGAGRVDNTALEGRTDVPTYTSSRFASVTACGRCRRCRRRHRVPLDHQVGEDVEALGLGDLEPVAGGPAGGVGVQQ
ncbi:hypothetical protein [Streptomyces sp. 3213.3]|uniref:hypothetical protein n=1 Tax=Streptomyces sp. 3213.3 TaxID=1855348 RepID=UPI00190EC388|nr:hypothetical protein [Streptomyces sp. 3213.3]